MTLCTVLVCSALLVLQITLSCACSCAFTDFETQYFRISASGQDLVEAEVTGTYIRRGRSGSGSFTFRFQERVYVLRVTKTYGCRTVPYFMHATTAIGSAACGVSLQRGVTYLLPLKKTGRSRLSSCGLIRPVSRLTSSETAFLESRQICCHGKCSCGGGLKSPVNCFVAPCRFAKPPCADAEKCEDNYCGGCRAEWFTENGSPACVRHGPSRHTISVRL